MLVFQKRATGMKSDQVAVGNYLPILHCVYLGIALHSSAGYHEPPHYPALICLGGRLFIFLDSR